MTSTLTPAPGSALDRLQKQGGGLDQMGEAEGGIPRIKIIGTKALYADSLASLEVPTFKGVICGLAKGRILWPTEMGKEKASPLCRSRDFVNGIPNAETFPIKESGLDLKVIEEGTRIDCNDCKLKDWGSHPQRDTTWCSEQMHLIVAADLDGSGTQIPSILTLQRSGLKPARNYLAGFKRTQAEPFLFETEFGLDAQNMGSVNYAVPTFKRGEETPPELWESYANTYFAMSDYLTSDRSNEEEAEEPKAKKKVEPEEELPDF